MPDCHTAVTPGPDGTIPHHQNIQGHLCRGPHAQQSSSTTPSWTQPAASQRRTTSAPAPAAQLPQWVRDAARSPAAPVVAWGICLLGLGALLSAIGVAVGWAQFLDSLGSYADNDSANPQVLYFLGGLFSLAGLVCSALGLTRLVAKADVLFAARRS